MSCASLARNVRVLLLLPEQNSHRHRAGQHQLYNTVALFGYRKLPHGRNIVTVVGDALQFAPGLFGNAAIDQHIAQLSKNMMCSRSRRVFRCDRAFKVHFGQQFPLFPPRQFFRPSILLLYALFLFVPSNHSEMWRLPRH